MKTVLNDSGQKYCPSCNSFKNLEEYAKSKRSKVGVQTYCRICNGEQKKIYRATSNYKKSRREYDLLSKYRLTWEGYMEMYNSQGGRCPICLKALDPDNRRTVVDHCHATNIIRGLLCTSCNTSLGKFGDSIEVFKRAIKYIKNGGMK